MKIKEKILLKDNIANIILTDKECMGYVESIVIKATGLPEELIKNNLVLLTPRVNVNTNLEYSYVDSVYENKASIINIEVNYNKPSKNNFKNMKYICHLLLK